MFYTSSIITLIYFSFKNNKKSFFPDHALHEGLDDVCALVVVEEEVDDHAPEGREVDVKLAVRRYIADQQNAEIFVYFILQQ